MSEIELQSLILGLTGGATITSAISTMNVSNSKLAMPIGAMLFMAGWGQVIASFRNNETRNEEHKNHLTVLSLTVMGAAMALRMFMDKKMPTKTFIVPGITFMAAWVLIGKMIGQKKIEGTKDEQNNYQESSSNIGLITPILVFASMFIVNRIERPNSIPSGIGLPAFMTAWVVLAIVNSLKTI